jgi:hypothetical protein
MAGFGTLNRYSPDRSWPSVKVNIEFVVTAPMARPGAVVRRRNHSDACIVVILPKGSS